jgi:hypothetical protein
MKKIKRFRLFESIESSEIEQVKKIVGENQYISDKNVTEEKLISSEKWLVYISQQTIDHIKSHMGPSTEIGDAPGSYYTDSWRKGIEYAISKYEPKVGENPPFRTAWTGVDAGAHVGCVTIGFDGNLKDSDKKSYTYDRPVRGQMVPETIAVKEEEAEKTNFITIVGSKIGEVNGKGLISLWTTYPDFKDGKIDGKEIPMNRNEFENNGFYFKASKDFYDKIPGEGDANESFNHLRKFKSFNK